MDPKLSHITQFYLVLRSLTNGDLITQEQKQLMKSRLQKKDPTLFNLLIENCGQGKEAVLGEKFQKFIIENCKPDVAAVQQRHRRGQKSKTVHFAITPVDREVEKSPNKHPPNSRLLEESKKDEETPVPLYPTCLPPSSYLIIDQLKTVLTNHLRNQGMVTLDDHVNLQRLRDLVNSVLEDSIQIESFAPLCRDTESTLQQPISDDDVDKHAEIGDEVTLMYQQLKKLFSGILHTHMMLMQENISYLNMYDVFKYLVKVILDCDEFTFLLCRKNEWGVYSTQTDTIKAIVQDGDPQRTPILNELTEEVKSIKLDEVYHQRMMSPYPRVCETAKVSNFDGNYLIKFRSMDDSDVVFVFHWTKNDSDSVKSKFLKLANEFGFTHIVVDLCNFLVETVLTARVQYFNPLKISDKIQDLGNSFMSVSRYVLVDGIRKAFSKHYHVDREIVKSFDANQLSSEDKSGVRIVLKDAFPVVLLIKDFNVQKQQQRILWAQVILIQEKYNGYVNLCQEKSLMNKYFLRTGDSLLFEFNNKGELFFLSRPITIDLQKFYGFHIDSKMMLSKKIMYTDIFDNNPILPDIVRGVENWICNKQNYTQHQNFEMLIQVVNQQLKGFSVVLHENKEKRLTDTFQPLRIDSEGLAQELKLQLANTYSKRTSFQFLHQLQTSKQLDVTNSMVALFVPEAELKLMGGISKKKVAEEPKSTIRSRNQSSTSNNMKDGDEHSLSRAKSNSSLSINQEEVFSLFQPSEDDALLDNFEFNILPLKNKNEKRRLVWAILNRNDFVNEYEINLQVLGCFIKQLEYKYNVNDNPFHNYDHGVSVMQSAYYICKRPKIKVYLDNLTFFSTIISGLCHDVGHTARTNIFEINSGSKLALRYHDLSPLEQHHAATTMLILSNSNCNFLEQLSKEDFARFRRILIDNILQTDIKVHFNLMNNFENRMKDCLEPDSQPFGEGVNDMKMLTGMVIHTADFNGAAKEFSISRQWSQLVNLEFIEQYAQEEQLCIPQTQFLKNLDSLKVMSKSEMNFFKFIVKPLWTLLNKFTVKYDSIYNIKENQLDQAINNLNDTVIQWEEIHNSAAE